jgi:hypothetical protein
VRLVGLRKLKKNDITIRTLDLQACNIPPQPITLPRVSQAWDGCSRYVKKTPWPEPSSELYRPSDRRLSATLVPTFADTGCHMVSVTDPYGRILDFLDRSPTFVSSSSSIVLTRLSGPRSRPTTSQKIW